MRRLFTWKRLARVALALVVLVLVPPVVYYVVVRSQGRTELDSVLAQLDRDDPGWQLDDIVAATNANLPPDARNPAVIAAKAFALLPQDAMERFNGLPKWPDAEPNVMLELLQLKAKLLEAMEGTEPAVEAARGLADLSGVGGSVIALRSNGFDTDLDAEFDIASVSRLLLYDTVIRVEAGDADGAIRSARAGLGTARAIGNHPSGLGQKLRILAGANSVRATESVVNLSEPSTGLADLQAELLRESEAPKLFTALRGERAHFERICARIDSGASVGFVPDDGFRLNEAKFESIMVRTHLRGDLAFGLGEVTSQIAAAELPSHQRLVAIGARRAATDPRKVLTRVFTPRFETLCKSTLKSQGELAAVAVGIACERHRHRFGQWPAALADIPGDILAAVPTDPCDGLPLKYRRLADRVVVYSVGPDGVDHGGDLSEATPENRRDYGIRLYDVALRRQIAPQNVWVGPDPFADLPDAPAGVP